MSCTLRPLCPVPSDPCVLYPQTPVCPVPSDPCVLYPQTPVSCTLRPLCPVPSDPCVSCTLRPLYPQTPVCPVPSDPCTLRPLCVLYPQTPVFCTLRPLYPTTPVPYDPRVLYPQTQCSVLSAPCSLPSEILGDRLESERDGELAVNACLCYICAGNVDRLVTCWDRLAHCSASPLGLQDLVEKVMILRRAVDTAAGQATAPTPALAQKLSRYAELLAAQGNLTTALNYLGTSSEVRVTNGVTVINKVDSMPLTYIQSNKLISDLSI